MATVKFDLSSKSINAAIKRIKQIQKQIQSSIQNEFIRLSLLWIRDNAIQRLNSEALDEIIKSKIADSFSIEYAPGIGKLINSSDKAVYIEFGVGAVGEGSHPNAPVAGYEYNVPSDKKNADGSWTFTRRTTAGIDIKEENRLESAQKGGGEAIQITTRGQSGSLFMYNAAMDYANNPAIIQMLYNQAFNKYIK